MFQHPLHKSDRRGNMPGKQVKDLAARVRIQFTGHIRSYRDLGGLQICGFEHFPKYITGRCYDAGMERAVGATTALVCDAPLALRCGSGMRHGTTTTLLDFVISEEGV